MGVILESNRRRGCPLGVLLCNALFGNTCELDLLSRPQLEKEWTVAVRVGNHRRADDLVYAVASRDQITGHDRHVVVAARASALGVKSQGHRTPLAMLLAVAVARVVEMLDAFSIEWDQAQTVGDELVSQYGAILFDLDQIDSDCGDLGEHNTPQGVGKRDISVGKFELDAHRVGLARIGSAAGRRTSGFGLRHKETNL